MFVVGQKIHRFIDKVNQDICLKEMLKSYSRFLKSELSNHKHSVKPPLVIFDVDGTLVDLTSPIPPTISFYQNVKDMGYHTIILTARSEQIKDRTIDLLNKFGVKGYDDIILRPEKEKETAKFKTNVRKKLATSYDIVANVGDRIFDFEGGYNGKIIHLVRLKT